VFLNSTRYWLCCGLLPLLVGCAAMSGSPKPAPARVEAKKPSDKAPPSTKKKLPSAKDWGPELNMKQWMVQCSNSDLAMKRPGKFLWTYGKYCRTHLPCSRKACN
jgi:hypothetical protein